MASQPLTQRCLVLGGGGFLGGHLVEALRTQGYGVRVFDRVPAHAAVAGPVHGVEWFQGDFSNRGDLAAALESCQTVFHLVATTLPKASNENPIFDLESNLVATVRFLDAALKHGVKKVVFASSGGTVYGLPVVLPVPESHPTQPLCSYGIHKLAIEKYLHLYHSLHGLDYCVLRLSNPYGEHQRSDTSQGAIAVFLVKALRDEEVTIWGDGSVIRDYVYVRDVSRAFCQAAQREAATGVFNVGSGEGLSVNELLDAIEALLGRPIRRRYVEARPFDVPVNILDITLASQALGWRPRVPLREGLQRTFAWISRTAARPV